MSRSPEEVAKLMAAYSVSPVEQVRQTLYRSRLADAWGIQPGARVLEVGCGQGDMTAVLADRVGPTGRVLGIDTGPASYGAPINLGDSAAHLMSGPLGESLTILLDFDDWDGLPDRFDAAVLAHCAWYFSSLDDLTETLAKVRKRASVLLLAEWSLSPRFPDQVPHMLAVNLFGLASAFQPDTDRNIRCAFTERDLAQAISDSGWTIGEQLELERTDVEDGAWEVQAAMDLSDEDLEGVPRELRIWLRRMAGLLPSYPLPHASLPSLVYRAN